jgi:hypothetical protein
MSIGNLKDSGNQGNNMPWQWKVLQGLQEIANQTAQPLTCVEDSIALCAGGTLLTSTTIGADTGLDVNIIGGVTLEVNLDAANDQVGIYGYTNPADPSTFTGIKVDAAGELQVDVLTTPGTWKEDTAHVSGDVGSFVLGVRNDSNTAMTSANGDYSPVAVNANGAVAIQDGGNSITVDGGTGVSRTPSFARPSTASPGTGTVNAGAFSASFASVGTANALVGGMVLKPGETLNFDAGAINNTLAAITYNVTTNAGAELIIITLT